MVMVTAKLSKQKLLLIAALLVAVVVVLCLCLHGSGNSSETPDTAQEPVAVDVKTNEGRVAFLASFGWEVAEEPVQTQEVRVPTEPNEVFQRYNGASDLAGLRPHAVQRQDAPPLCLHGHKLSCGRRRPILRDRARLQKRGRRGRRLLCRAERRHALVHNALLLAAVAFAGADDSVRPFQPK